MHKVYTQDLCAFHRLIKAHILATASRDRREVVQRFLKTIMTKKEY